MKSPQEMFSTAVGIRGGRCTSFARCFVIFLNIVKQNVQCFLVMFDVSEWANTVFEIPELNKKTFVEIKKDISHFNDLCKKHRKYASFERCITFFQNIIKKSHR